jgi:anti-sigma factor RsiW
MTGRLTCREFTEFLAEYLEGELPESERLRFAEHLAACPPCVSYLKTYRDAIRLGRDACAAEREAAMTEVPEALIRAVLAVLGSEV